MPVASCVDEMEIGASETLLNDYRRRCRRFRRRVRRRPSGQEDEKHASPSSTVDADVPAEDDKPPVNLDDAIHAGDDTNVDDIAQEVADGDVSSDWSLERIERAQNVDRLEQILLAENDQFHLHC